MPLSLLDCSFENYFQFIQRFHNVWSKELVIMELALLGRGLFSGWSFSIFFVFRAYIQDKKDHCPSATISPQSRVGLVSIQRAIACIVFECFSTNLPTGQPLPHLEEV